MRSESRLASEIVRAAALMHGGGYSMTRAIMISEEATQAQEISAVPERSRATFES